MNFLYKVYFFLPNFAFLGIVGKIINRLLSIILKRIFDLIVPGYLKRTSHKVDYGLNRSKREETYIVSLTSFPARINDIWITIETILRQSFKPDKIILWLAKEQFPNRKLPESLEKLKERGLTIEFCEDLKSHKKYYYSMSNYPKANIITLDDDSYYPRTVLQDLVELHYRFPKVICANRAHKIEFAGESIRPYRQWEINYKKFNKPTFTLVPTGVGGVLYPSASLDKEVFNKDIFKKICFQADDLWLKVCSYVNGTQILSSKYYNKDLIAVSKTQQFKLLDQNSFGGGNDQQLKAVCDYFKVNLREK